MREDARNNPDLFKRKFKAKFDNRLPKDDDIKRPDEKYYLAFIKESMNYYRNLFLWNQAEKIVGKDVLKLTTKPQKPKILTMPRAEDYALAA